MATVEPEELKKKTKMVAYDTLSEISQIVPNHTNLFCPKGRTNGHFSPSEGKNLRFEIYNLRNNGYQDNLQ
jgi:hypothetical protein